jgi:amino acid transporter
MTSRTSVVKRLLVGRARRSAELRETLLPKWLALPIFASDLLSSVAYATQEILIVLSLAGLAYLWLTGWIGLAVVLLTMIVVVSYRQVVAAYPSGGGSYEVASVNLGANAGLAVAAALMTDYVLTVAVSVAAGVDNFISAFPSLSEHRVPLALAAVALLTVMNLRGVRESGAVFAIPVYAFIASVLVMIVVGLGRALLGDRPVAESAGWSILPEHGHTSIAGLALVVLALRAFATGCSSLTGIEAVSNGVPAFRPPKSANAAATMVTMGVLSVVMFSGITALALISKVHITHDTCRLVGFPGDCSTTPQRTVIAQLAAAVFGGTGSPGFYLIQAVTTAILILAANTAYNGFPQLASILAEQRFLPRQMHTRGDRLAFSNGILLLAAVAAVLLYVHKASVTALIPLFILGVFTSFTLSQTGMVRHWNRLLAEETDPVRRRSLNGRRIINAVGAGTTGGVLVIVVATKFTQGAWQVILAAAALFLLMRGIRRHYDAVTRELAPTPDDIAELPPRVHAIVLVSKIHKPTLRALGVARAIHPHRLEALSVNVDPEETATLRRGWEQREIPVPLKILDSPFREITRPVVDYIKGLRRGSPRDAVIIFIPEYVVGHWWEQLLHNQSALRLKARLLFTPGVVVANVPWQLASSARAAARPEPPAPGALRSAHPVESRPEDLGVESG